MKDDQLKILDSYEFTRKADLEMDSQIYNGGSGAYAYLIEQG